MHSNWMTKAIRCCGGPALFYSLTFTGLGIVFLILTLPMALTLALFSAGFVSLATFAVLAYRAHRQGDGFVVKNPARFENMKYE